MKPGSPEYEELFKNVKQDEQGTRYEYIFGFSFLDSLILSVVEDPRDKIMVYTTLNILFITFGSALTLFIYRPFSHLLAVGYLVVNYALFLQRFILMLHFSEHRRLFKKKYDYLNYIIPYVIAPLFGIPSGVYKLHHVVMHHKENNVFPWDVSSTEPYDRATVLGYLKYWGYWMIAIWVLTPYYLVKRKQWKLVRKCAKNLSGFFLVVFVMYMINPMATFYVLLLPLALATFFLSFGNYSQHIFIDPNNPKSNYGLAYNCVNCPDNMRTFNDGYHIVHHIQSTLHWTLLPDHFIQNIDKYIEEDAINFLGLGFFDVGVMVVTRQYHKLAKHYIRLSDKYKTDEDVVKMLKNRLQRIEHKEKPQ